MSVIIPCYNKGHILKKTLLALNEQTLPVQEFEVIIVDDGSSDNTKEVVNNLVFDFRISLLSQNNKGAGAARNAGAFAAIGEILFFLDADIVLKPIALQEHLQANTFHKNILTASRIIPTKKGSTQPDDKFFQNSFDFGPDEKLLHWRDTKTQALSIKKEHFLQIGQFDNAFRRGQDIEFGYRAAEQGFAIRYCPKAVGVHYHPMTLTQRLQTEQRNHKYLAYFFVRYPELVPDMPHIIDKWPIQWQTDSLRLVVKKMVRQLLARRPVLASQHLVWCIVQRLPVPENVLNSLYWKLLGSYQLIGLYEGLNQLQKQIPSSNQKEATK